MYKPPRTASMKLGLSFLSYLSSSVWLYVQARAAVTISQQQLCHSRPWRALAARLLIHECSVERNSVSSNQVKSKFAPLQIV